jgi:alpha-tubulin suppressor-like RCC1 family protein
MRLPFRSSARPRRCSILFASVLLAAGACRDLPDEPVETGGSSLLTAAAAPLAFRQIDEGFEFSCGVTTGDVAYCWGGNSTGALGDGTTTDRARPTRVKGSLRFRHVSAGIGHACGLTTDGRVFCWGDNSKGQLGNNGTVRRTTPVLVTGGRRYIQVRAGNLRTCALTTENVAYCWGFNIYGSLGTGDSTIKRKLVPTKVAGNVRFDRLSGRNFHVCGLTTAGKAWCWGNNEDGRLGDGTVLNRQSPVAVAGGKVFQSLNAGGAHSCGVASDARVYCWGENLSGQLGDGTTDRHLTPQPIAGNLSFAAVSTGSNRSTCGVTLGHVAYCWGQGDDGILGDGSTDRHLVPTAVGGGLSFEGVTIGNHHACGVVRSTHAGYCWGRNDRGQLGDGSHSTHFLPFAVAAPS